MVAHKRVDHLCCDSFGADCATFCSMVQRYYVTTPLKVGVLQLGTRFWYRAFQHVSPPTEQRVILQWHDATAHHKERLNS